MQREGRFGYRFLEGGKCYLGYIFRHWSHKHTAFHFLFRNEGEKGGTNAHTQREHKTLGRECIVCEKVKAEKGTERSE